MTFNVDAAIDAAGGFGRFQLLATVLLSWPHCISGLQAMLWVFTGNEPTFQAALCPIVHFPRAILGTSASVDWGLVCKKQYQATLISAAFFFGFMLGTVALGSISDKFGRRPALLVSMLCSQLASAGCALAPTPLLFAVSRVLAGIGVGGMGLVAFVWNAELLGRHRYILSLCMNMAFAIGVCLLTFMAWRMPFWRDQCWATFWWGIPNFIVVYWVPDSPKWLDSASKSADARKVINYIATFNRRVMPKIVEDPKLPSSQGTGPLALVRHPLRRRSMVMCAAFFACSLCYFGLALNSGSLTPNFYAANAIGALVEVPAYFVVFLFVDTSTVGRRNLTLYSLVSAGAACLIAGMAPPKSQRLLCAAMLARFAVAGANATLYLWGAELFPTCIRAAALGVLSMTARLAAVLSPFVFAYTDNPLIVIGVPAMLAGVISSQMPETVGRPMPDTIEDVTDSELKRLLPHSDTHGKA